LIAFENSKAYPIKPGTLSAQDLAKFVENYREECKFCGQAIREPRSELTMYLEYTKNTLANSPYYIDTYNYLMERTNNTFVHDKILAPYFGPKVGKKQVGARILFWVIVPSIAILYELLSCLLCKKKEEEKPKKKKSATKKKTADGDGKTKES